MNLAFYIAEHDDWKGKLTDLLSGRYGYSHVELVFSDGMSFSASARDGGTRLKKIDFNPDHWVTVPFPKSVYRERIIRKRAELLCDKEYDWAGIFINQLLGLGWQNDEKWWCSEVVCHVLRIRPEKISPNDLARHLGVLPAKKK